MTPDQMSRVAHLALQVDVDGWMPQQLECFEHVFRANSAGDVRLRLCLYYPTGSGKTITSLVALHLWSVMNPVLVIAPPATHDVWKATAKKIGMRIECMSHAKFRMKSTKLSKHQAVIADEFHLFGGHAGKGWQKLDRLAKGLDAPLILMSATPNYNDADRVYCIQHVLAPHTVKGGFLEFLYKHCVTEQNPFSMTPNVLGFQRFKNAAEYLESLPDVLYLPDTLSYVIDDFPIREKIPPEMEEFGLDPRRKRIIASIIEEKHARVFHSLITDDGYIESDVLALVRKWIENEKSSVLIYANHSTVATALSASLTQGGIRHQLVTGSTPPGMKQHIIEDFRQQDVDVLIGTATLATGTDGLDKVSNLLVIVDDTEDDALRRQLIGRIMPRGVASSSAHKQVRRLVLQ